MRSKIQFNDEVNVFIKDEFSKGTSQSTLIELLKSNYNINCGLTTLRKQFKVLGLHGNDKRSREELKPWRKIFTNEIFPDPVVNCIMLDLINHSNPKQISSAHKLPTASIKRLADSIKLDKKTVELFNSYRKIFQFTNSTQLVNYSEQFTNKLKRVLKEKLGDKAEIITLYKKEIGGKTFTFDFYCPQIDKYFIGGGILSPYVNAFNKLGYNVIQLREWELRGGEITAYTEDETINMIISIISDELKGKKFIPTRGDYKPMTEQEILNGTYNMILKDIKNRVGFTYGVNPSSIKKLRYAIDAKDVVDDDMSE